MAKRTKQKFSRSQIDILSERGFIRPEQQQPTNVSSKNLTRKSGSRNR